MSTLRTTTLALLLAGCDGNKDTAEGPSCEDTPTVLAADEASPLGFTGQQVADLAEGEQVALFQWTRDVGDASLVLTVANPGEVRFVDSEPVYPEGTSPAIGVVCEDRLEVDVDMTFVFDDGAFDEAWTGPLVATEQRDRVGFAVATFRHELDPDALSGTYDMDLDITEPDYDERRLWIEGAFDADGSTGSVGGQISGEDEDCQPGEACAAWAGEVSVGTWTEPAD